MTKESDLKRITVPVTEIEITDAVPVCASMRCVIVFSHQWLVQWE